MSGTIRVGVGGWVFPPWRGSFYPKGLRQKDELSYASRKLTAIEINSTYHSTHAPADYARWAAETPEDYVFAIKGSRVCTNRKVLADIGPSLEKFMGQGFEELGSKLGPFLWQLMDTKKFDEADFADFLELLPARLGGRELRHCIEPRHASFADDRFIALCRDRGVAICLSDSAKWPLIDETTADFAYARLMRGDDAEPTCYKPAALDAWVKRLQREAAAGRDAFAFFIRAGKVRAPAGAMALIERLTAPA
jgi:uncharacterized protein YecE (DUF72 family)